MAVSDRKLIARLVRWANVDEEAWRKHAYAAGLAIDYQNVGKAGSVEYRVSRDGRVVGLLVKHLRMAGQPDEYFGYAFVPEERPPWWRRVFRFPALATSSRRDEGGES